MIQPIRLTHRTQTIQPIRQTHQRFTFIVWNAKGCFYPWVRGALTSDRIAVMYVAMMSNLFSRYVPRNCYGPLFKRATLKFSHRLYFDFQPQTFVCDTDHDHSPIEIEFSTMDEALAWRFDEEHDRYFSIRQSRKNFKHFHCSQKHEGKKQERVKNSKKVHNCPAKYVYWEILFQISTY